jgi:hypothetical protein
MTSGTVDWVPLHPKNGKKYLKHLRHSIDSYQLHAPAVLLPGKELLVHIRPISEPVSVAWVRERTIPTK